MSATAAKPKKGQSIRQAGASSKREPIVVPVTFGTVSIGLKTCRIGISIERKTMQITKADEIFVDRRLVGRIEVVREGESPNQSKFLDDDKIIVEGAFDVTQFSAAAEHYGTGLNMRKASVDVTMLDRFIKRSGFLIIESTGEIIKEKPPRPGDDNEIDFGEPEDDAEE